MKVETPHNQDEMRYKLNNGAHPRPELKKYQKIGIAVGFVLAVILAIVMGHTRMAHRAGIKWIGFTLMLVGFYLGGLIDAHQEKKNNQDS